LYSLHAGQFVGLYGSKSGHLPESALIGDTWKQILAETFKSQ